MAIKARDKFKLDYTITEFKKEKVEDKDMDLIKAEKLLKELTSRDSMYSFTDKCYFFYLGTVYCLDSLTGICYFYVLSAGFGHDLFVIF